ncbi:MAG: hypothetical protein C6W57_12760 [Caldibacillus debilis]|nr:MAG: hypothetical protein C6W57_12760 [Caldibacillus debilis]
MVNSFSSLFPFLVGYVKNYTNYFNNQAGNGHESELEFAIKWLERKAIGQTPIAFCFQPVIFRWEGMRPVCF